ncbi:MAG: GtrA family protein [Solirubrobacteraceae bacterium]
MSSPVLPPPPVGAPIIAQLAKYGVVGIANSLIGFAIYVAAVKLGVQYLLASTVAYAVGSVNGYFLNRRWTFQAGAVSHLSSATRYAAVQAGALLGNLVLLFVLVHLLGVEKIIAQAVVVVIVFLATFAANRIWSFAHRGAPELAPTSGGR